jgi:RNA polymerase sigma factor (sigma-70 family)
LSLTVKEMAEFLTTRWSMVARATDLNEDGQQALSSLCEVYWPPLFTYAVKCGLTREDARDAMQDFFSHFLSKGWLERVEMDRGKFRTFLLTALKRHLVSQWRHQAAQKRGGEYRFFQINEALLTAEEANPATWAGAELSPEQAYDRRWALAVLAQAMKRLQRDAQAAGRADWFEQMQPFLSTEANDGDYHHRAERLGITSNAFAQAVRRLRQSYREAVREEIAETVQDKEQVEEEMQTLIAVLRS